MQIGMHSDEVQDGSIYGLGFRAVQEDTAENVENTSFGSWLFPPFWTQLAENNCSLSFLSTPVRSWLKTTAAFLSFPDVNLRIQKNSHW